MSDEPHKELAKVEEELAEAWQTLIRYLRRSLGPRRAEKEAIPCMVNLTRTTRYTEMFSVLDCLTRHGVVVPPSAVTDLVLGKHRASRPEYSELKVAEYSSDPAKRKEALADVMLSEAEHGAADPAEGTRVPRTKTSDE